MTPTFSRFHLWAAAASSLALLLTGCGKPAAAPAPPPPTITVAKPLARKIIEHNEYTGRMAAIENVSVRPRVSGYITEIPFKEGNIVKKDDLLFVIDPRPYQAALNQAAGQLKLAQAQKELNDRNFTRAETLQATKVSSKEEFDQAATNRNQGDAQVASAQAAVDAAKLNLEFTQVKSPIAGRVGREQVTVGNLVANDTTVLTNIVSVDPIYAYADVDERAVIAYQKLIAEGKVKDARDAKVPVAVAVAGEQGFPHQGDIDFVDNQINAATGTLSVRGKFSNADGNLLSGMFVRMQIPVSGEIDALLITDRAVGSDQGQKFVYVVNGDKAERRPVALGPVIEGLRIVTQGSQTRGPGRHRRLDESAARFVRSRPSRADMEKFASDQLEMKSFSRSVTSKGGAGKK